MSSLTFRDQNYNSVNLHTQNEHKLLNLNNLTLLCKTFTVYVLLIFNENEIRMTYIKLEHLFHTS